MQNRLAVFLCNLKPAKMRGILSEGMIMCASSPEKVQIIDVPEGAAPGDRVAFKDFAGNSELNVLSLQCFTTLVLLLGEPDKQMNPKKKIWETIQPELRVNGECVATYKGCPFSISGKGVCMAPGCAGSPIK